MKTKQKKVQVKAWGLFNRRNKFTRAFQTKKYAQYAQSALEPNIYPILIHYSISK